MNCRQGLVPAMLLLLMVGGSAAQAINCPDAKLPHPSEPFSVTQARLEAAGQWHKNRSVPDDPQLGDTWDWYIWNLAGYPHADLKPCTIRGVGQNVFVVVDDDEWNVGGMNQAAVDRIVSHFDNQSPGPFPDQGIWDLDTSYFGTPPNPLDGQDRIFLLYYRFNMSADGFFWSFDQYPDGSQAWASNEADVIYMATDNGDPGGDYMLSVTAHEFQHLIHFNYDQNEETWVNEGLSELAMWLFGNPDNITSFNSNTDNSLTSWTGAWADYIKAYLWTLYLYEQHGGQDLTLSVTQNPNNGMYGYQTSLQALGQDVDMGDIFGDWCLANYLHDTSIDDGRYGYQGDTLPLFWAWRIVTSVPVSGNGSVSAWAGESMRLLNLTQPLGIDFDGQDSRDYRVYISSKGPGLPTLVDRISLDEFNAGSLAHHDGYNEAVLTVANVNGAGQGSYTYAADYFASPVPETGLAAVDLRCRPNPFNPRTVLSFELPTEAMARVLIHDSRGHLVQVLQNGPLPAGEHHFAWDGKGLPSGVYFGSLEIGGQVTAVRKLTLVQ